MEQIIRLIDSNTKENVNYEETSLWHDGSVMDDSKVDNVIYRKKTDKYYALTQFLAGNLISVQRFGAKGDGNTNDYVAFQRSLDVLGYIYMNQGNYLIEGTIENTKFTEMVNYYSNNGIIISGVTIIGSNRNKVSIINKNVGAPLFRLNGNPDNQATIGNPLAQTHNYIGGFTLIGNGINDDSLFEINALWIANFNDIIIKNYGVAFNVLGSDPPDAATSNLLLFDKIFAQHGKVFFNSVVARTGSTKFTNSEFRYLSDVAIRGAFAGLEINNCQISHCGNKENSKSAGVRIITPEVPSTNRAVKIENCMFEANKWSDILVENCSGMNISTNTFHPYYYLDAGEGNEQVCVRVEGDTIGVDGVVLNANRTSGMSNPATGPEISRFLKVSGKVKNISVDGLSAPIYSHLPYLFDISQSTDNFNTKSFRASAGWKIPGNTVPVLFTGDNTLFDIRTLSQYIVRTYDNAGGIDGSGNFIGSRFDNQFAYIIPWSGLYLISGLVRLNLTDGREARIVVESDQTVTTPFKTDQSTFSVIKRLQKGTPVNIYIQVVGTIKNVGFITSPSVNAMEFNIVQL